MSWVVATQYGPAEMPLFPPDPGYADERLVAAYWAEAERRAGKPTPEQVLDGAPCSSDDWYEALALVLAERSPA